MRTLSFNPPVAFPYIYKNSVGVRDHLGATDATKLVDASRQLAVASYYCEASNATGGYVTVSPETRCLPVLVRDGNSPVLLYEFVEAVEDLIDYDDVLAQFPGLKYAQVHGALAFLRRLSQFNAAGLDIDALECQALAADPSFILELSQAVADSEMVHVLDAG